MHMCVEEAAEMEQGRGQGDATLERRLPNTSRYVFFFVCAFEKRRSSAFLFDWFLDITWYTHTHSTIERFNQSNAFGKLHPAAG